jgi:Spy/CpxP family protein refolding chaperone
MKSLHVILLAAVIPLAATAFAQPQAGPKKAPAAETDEKKSRPARAERLADLRQRLLRDRVGLSAEKTRAIEAIVQQSAPERAAAQTELADARRELAALFASDSDDQAAWATALAKMKEAHATAAALREREYEAIAAVLTPKEQAQLLRAMERVQGHARAERRKRGDLKNPFREEKPGGPPKKKPPKTPAKSLKDPFGRR